MRERAPLPVAWSSDVVFCTSLSGRELSRFSGVFGLVVADGRAAEVGQQAPQYVLEEILREAVDELDSCTLVTGHRVGGVEQDDGGVRVTVVGADGRPYVVECQFLIGADGPRSVVREAIGAEYRGVRGLRPNFGMVFEAPGLWPVVRHGAAVQYWIVNDGAPALMGPIDRSGTWWLIAIGLEREVGERDGPRIVDAAAGVAVGATVLSTDPWTARMQIVDRMRDRRVFLAGDAAHLNPPFGGHGLNTGIGDAVDLGWKIAAVLDGWGGPGLLDSYEAERRPVQERIVREAAANMAVLSPELLDDALDADSPAGEAARAAAHLRIQESKRAEFHSLDLVLGLELGGELIGSGGGGRLAHVWLADGWSVYDSLGAGLTLLVLGGDGVGADGLVRAAGARGVPLKVVDLRGRRLRERYGADFVLVRPDQHVAWRGDGLPEDALGLVDRVRGASS